MYSKTITIGNLTRDIELRYLPSGAAVAKGSIAYTDGFGDKKKSHFIDFVAFSKTAEALNNYTRKGSKVMLEGVVQFEQWTVQDGTNRSKHVLRVDTMKMLDSKSDNQPTSRPQQNGQIPVEYERQSIPDDMDIDSEMIPF